MEREYDHSGKDLINTVRIQTEFAHICRAYIRWCIENIKHSNTEFQLSSDFGGSEVKVNPSTQLN